MRRAVFQVRDLHHLQYLNYSPPDLSFRPAQLQRPEGHFVKDCGTKELNVRVLEDERDPPPELESERFIGQLIFRQSPTDSRGHGSTRLYTIDLTGSNQREVVTPQDASDPAWSPLLR